MNRKQAETHINMDCKQSFKEDCIWFYENEDYKNWTEQSQGRKLSDFLLTVMNTTTGNFQRIWNVCRLLGALDNNSEAVMLPLSLSLSQTQMAARTRTILTSVCLVYFSPPGKILGWYFKLGHDRLLAIRYCLGLTALPLDATGAHTEMLTASFNEQIIANCTGGSLGYRQFWCSYTRMERLVLASVMEVIVWRCWWWYNNKNNNI